MENIISIISTVIFAGIGLVIAVGVGIRVFRDLLSKSRTVAAVVADKQSFEGMVYGKDNIPHSKHNYVVWFMVGRRKMHFDVSELSYNTYKIGQKGKLTYKGNRLIEFN